MEQGKRWQVCQHQPPDRQAPRTRRRFLSAVIPLQLYSLATPNGQKVTIMLEELLALGHTGAEYDAWLIRINEGDQFSSGFVAANPNSKIPALMDHSEPRSCARVRIRAPS